MSRMVAKKLQRKQWRMPEVAKHCVLTDRQRLVLRLLTDEKEGFESAYGVAIRLKITHQAVYKHIKVLRKKGVLEPVATYKNTKWLREGGYPMGVQQPHLKMESPLFPVELRLHGLHYVFKLVRVQTSFVSKRYVDGNTVVVSKRFIDVYVNKSFFGGDVEVCKGKAQEYVNRLVVMIENELKLKVWRDRRGVRLVKWHFGKEGDELAREANARKERLLARWEDGKVWLHTDASFSEDELETVHRDSADVDMGGVVVPFMNDLKRFYMDNGEPFRVVDMVEKVVKNQLVFAENMRSHVGAVQELGRGVRELNKLIKEMRKR